MKKRKISKPWAVYGGVFGPRGIGLIVDQDKNYLYIQNSENQRFTAQCFGREDIFRFNTPKLAINYFLKNSNQYSKKELKKIFLKNFPTQKKRLEKILTLSLPKCTDYNCDSLGDEIGRVSHPYQ